MKLDYHMHFEKGSYDEAWAEGFFEAAKRRGLDEIGCTMPVADDLGWLPKDRYIGRSGRHIAPGLYLAVGISGAAQHMEGVRDAKVVAAINNDPEARIFRTADYGVVGDLYEVVPALIDALDASTASPVGH